MKRWKSTLAIVCAVLVLASCKKIFEFIPEHGGHGGHGGHSSDSSKLREVISTRNHLWLSYATDGLLDSIRFTTPSSNQSYLVFRYAYNAQRRIDSVTAFQNGNWSYSFQAFHYDDQGRLKDYVKWPHGYVTDYALQYDWVNNIYGIIRWIPQAPYAKSDSLGYDDRHNVTYWRTSEIKNPFRNESHYSYDTGANPLNIKNIFVALIDDPRYQEYVFSPNNTTQKRAVINTMSEGYDAENQYDSKGRLVQKILRPVGNATADTLRFRYY